jgi:multicomponent K+:H+ antiporter subunit A
LDLALVILLPLVAGTVLAPLAARVGATASAWAAALVTAAALGLLLALAPAVFAGDYPRVAWEWLPQIGAELAFRVDGLALLFGILITAIGLLVILYARYYLHHDERAGDERLGRFYGTLMLFMAAMLGIVLSDNLLVLVVFWELTSLSSFLLIGYRHREADSRRGARMALTVTGAGGLALLAGCLLLGHIAGTFEIGRLNAMREVIQAHPLYPAALVLILLGAFTKSAQFPFHFWLPHAMAAPTPVSAYLHSATMVKAGIFLVARLYPALGDSTLFEVLVTTTGLATLVFAAFVAIFKHDIKGLLAYSTVSHLGLVMFLLGLDGPLSAVAAIFHVVNHATFKASLFMAAGIIDHECGTRDMRRINGLAKYMPWTATLAIVASASMAGVPLLNGFLSKEMFFAEALEVRDLGWLGAVAPWAATLAGILSVAYSARFIHDVFFNGEPRDLPRTPHEPPRWMKVPVEVLVVLCVVVGILPAFTVQPLVAIAARDVFGAPLPEFTFAIWHGFNLPLAMSVVAVVGGIALYALLARGMHDRTSRGLDGRRMFEATLGALVAASRRALDALANGSLQRYLAILLVVAIAVTAAPLLERGLPAATQPLLAVHPAAIAVWAMVVLGAVGAVVAHRARLLAVILAGAVGLGTALVFVHFSAPDLALTQLSIEVVSTVLLIMGLALLPQRSPRESSTGRRVRDAGIAIAAGGGLGAMAWAVMMRPAETISWFFLENTVPKGGGANAVNVILVDFRGYDTLGEITVLGIAAIGVLALMDGFRTRRPATDASGRPWSPDLYPLLLGVTARWILPFALVVSIYIFLRGHNAPGGGFIAGLVTAAGLLLQYMARGFAATGRSLGGLDFSRAIGAGLLIAAATGAGAWIAGHPFLTSAHGHPHLPLLGELPLATAALFDLGVYVVVVGATMLTLVTLGAVTERGANAPAPAPAPANVPGRGGRTRRAA